MSKLIILSNRVQISKTNHAAGGLAVALTDALQTVGGTWVGWNGQRVENRRQQKFQIQQQAPIEFHTTALTEQQYQGFYCGFANDALWPCMHTQPNSIHAHPHDFSQYQQVNLYFAQHLHKIAGPQDMIWIHDYHFLSVAYYCRKLGMRHRIGFFLHVPFPQLDTWQHLPQAALLANHLKDYDLIGLQTQHDQINAMQMLQHYTQLKADHPQQLRAPNHSIAIKHYPIGVQPQVLQQQAALTRSTALDLPNYANQKTIISVDRIDYSKGLLEKFAALSQLLQHEPDYKRRFWQLQIACPCRLDVASYAQLYQHFQQQIQQFNTDFSEADWQPVHCYENALPHAQLMQLYRQADICWVNSIRDGMNLVAKEYIAAQDPNDPGILILSRYTGAAEQMSQALLVDPHDQRSMQSALKYALKMPKSERLQRYQALYQGLQHYDIQTWRKNFLYDLKRPCQNPRSSFKNLTQPRLLTGHLD